MRSVKRHPEYWLIYVADNGEIWEEVEGNVYSKDVNKRYTRCILGNLHQDKYGYSIYTPRLTTCRLNKLIDRKKLKVHQLVAITFLDNPLNKKMVNHKNYIKSDNRVENLEWVSLKENNQGPHRKKSHYTKEQRKNALILLDQGWTIKEVSKKLNITVNTLSEAK